MGHAPRGRHENIEDNLRAMQSGSHAAAISGADAGNCWWRGRTGKAQHRHVAIGSVQQ